MTISNLKSLTVSMEMVKSKRGRAYVRVTQQLDFTIKGFESEPQGLSLTATYRFRDLLRFLRVANTQGQARKQALQDSPTHAAWSLDGARFEVRLMHTERHKVELPVFDFSKWETLFILLKLAEMQDRKLFTQKESFTIDLGGEPYVY